METLTFHGSGVNIRSIDRAVELLEAGSVIIYPTDTLYALGCDALNARAVGRLCDIKGLNPAKNLLSIVCDSLSMASEYARIDNHAFRLLKANLPGPFTSILPTLPRLPRVFRDRHSVGIRIPDNAVARKLVETLGRPVLTTSVAIDDDDESMEPESVAMHYEHQADAILDAGPGLCIPSAVIDITDPSAPEVIREGPADLKY